ncbi:MAG: hypothetical protein M1820_001789 [Bogoriella megaspora]|nr:MAG: hypothetical protein M1820_001789 [Bogoriella megaspora]
MPSSSSSTSPTMRPPPPPTSNRFASLRTTDQNITGRLGILSRRSPLGHGRRDIIVKVSFQAASPLLIHRVKLLFRGTQRTHIPARSPTSPSSPSSSAFNVSLPLDSSLPLFDPLPQIWEGERELNPNQPQTWEFGVRVPERAAQVPAFYHASSTGLVAEIDYRVAATLETPEHGEVYSASVRVPYSPDPEELVVLAGEGLWGREEVERMSVMYEGREVNLKFGVQTPSQLLQNDALPIRVRLEIPRTEDGEEEELPENTRFTLTEAMLCNIIECTAYTRHPVTGARGRRVPPERDTKLQPLSLLLEDDGPGTPTGFPMSPSAPGFAATYSITAPRKVAEPEADAEGDTDEEEEQSEDRDEAEGAGKVYYEALFWVAIPLQDSLQFQTDLVRNSYALRVSLEAKFGEGGVKVEMETELGELEIRSPVEEGRGFRGLVGAPDP